MGSGRRAAVPRTLSKLGAGRGGATAAARTAGARRTSMQVKVAAWGDRCRGSNLEHNNSLAGTSRTRVNNDLLGFYPVSSAARGHFGAVKRLGQRGCWWARHHGAATENRRIRLTENTLRSTQRRPNLKKNKGIKTPSRPPHRHGRLPVSPVPVEGGRFTFVTVSAAVRVEVISVPQPAHLRHLGN